MGNQSDTLHEIAICLHSCVFVPAIRDIDHIPAGMLSQKQQ